MKKNYLLLCLSIVTLMLVLSVVFIVNKKSANIDKYEESVENVTHDTKANEIITPFSEDIGSNEIYENSNSQNSSNSKNVENVEIKVEENTITSSGLTIIITDNNEEQYGWGESYGIQEKVNGEWKKLKANTDFNSVAYLLDENHQIRQNINWVNSYGKLPNGIYRIEKEADGNVFYSNEFIIK